MKKSNREKIFLSELQKIPNISVAAEKVGLSRQTIYRWMQEDPSFRKKVEAALFHGVEHINDLSKSKLISLISNADLKAIKYWLSHKDPDFFPKDIYSRKEKELLGGADKVKMLDLLRLVKMHRRSKQNGEELTEENIDKYLD